MSTFTALIRQLPLEQFQDILQASGRQAREATFARHHIRAPKVRPTAVRASNKNAVRGQKLYEILATEHDEPLAEELMRHFLLGQRALLAKGLDLLNIPHDNGLTDSPELQRLVTLKPAEAEALAGQIEASGVEGSAYARMWLSFMKLEGEKAQSEE